jgi:elongation factor P
LIVAAAPRGRYAPRAMMRAALDLRPGDLISYDNRKCSVVKWNILRNDRRQFVQMRIRDIETGRQQELKESGDSKYEVLEKEERELTYSYRDGPVEVFFTEDGEEIRCSAVSAEDALAWGVDTYTGYFVNGELLTVFPPRFAVCVVTQTAPPVKNAGTGLKEATLENGMVVRVSNIIDIGDRVRIETETMEFKERVTD